MESKIYKGCKRLYKSEKANNLREILDHMEKNYKDKVAFKFKTDKPGVFKTMTYGEYIEEINALGTALVSLGLKDKRIAVISENRYEWAVTYFATVNGTGIIVPLDRSLSEIEIMNLIDTGALTYDDLVRVTSYRPAELLGLNTKGAIEAGYDADLTIFDPNKEYIYTKDMVVSKSKNSPFIDEKMKGKVVYTIVGGRIVYSN